MKAAPPRMYVDDTMLGLIGLREQIAPEDTYHTWYDHIDEGSFGLVSEAVEKMIAGEHAEVQYPWHHPSGKTMIVRCGGVRDPDYRAGIRVEGTHQDITALAHFQEEKARLAEGFEEALAAEYQILYYLDLANGKATFVRGDEEARKFSQIFDSGSMANVFPNFHRYYVDAAVVEEDRERVESVISEENIRRVLTTENSVSVNYRVRRNLIDPVYTEMRIIKAGVKDGRLTAVILAFRLTDEAVSNALRTSELLVRRQQENLLAGFLKGYQASYLGNLFDGSYKVLRGRDDLWELIGRSETLTDVFRQFAEEFVHPDDQSLFTSQLCDMKRLRESLDIGISFSFEYRGLMNGSYSWRRATVNRLSETELLASFSDCDEEVRAAQMRKIERQRNTEIIEILASEYSSVYYIDLTTEELNPYTMNAETESEFGQIFNSGITYSEAFRLYVDKLVFPEDKAMMLKAGSVENIRSELSGK